MSPKRTQMVDATVQLLRGEGLSGATLNRALEQSGAPKGSLYHYFPGGKSELLGAALGKFSEDFSQLLTAHFSKKEPFPARWGGLIRAMIRGLARSNFTLGCPVAATLLGLDGDDNALRLHAQAALQTWADLLSESLPELPVQQRRGFSEALLALLEGALILSRAQKSEGPLLQVVEFGSLAHAQACAANASSPARRRRRRT